MATAEDEVWAARALLRFNVLFAEEGEAIAELLASGVSGRRIEILYPFNMLGYARRMESMLVSEGVLFDIIGSLMLSTIAGSVKMIYRPVSGIPETVQDQGREVLRAIFALPEEQRPGQFILRQEFHEKDFDLALKLVVDLLLTPLYLKLLANRKASGMANVSVVADRGRIERMLAIFEQVPTLGQALDSKPEIG